MPVARFIVRIRSKGAYQNKLENHSLVRSWEKAIEVEKTLSKEISTGKGEQRANWQDNGKRPPGYHRNEGWQEQSGFLEPQGMFGRLLQDCPGIHFPDCCPQSTPWL